MDLFWFEEIVQKVKAPLYVTVAAAARTQIPSTNYDILSRAKGHSLTQSQKYNPVIPK